MCVCVLGRGGGESREGVQEKENLRSWGGGLFQGSRRQRGLGQAGAGEGLEERRPWAWAR